jgi:predicted DNA-binding transcriptional regulator AlpA
MHKRNRQNPESHEPNAIEPMVGADAIGKVVGLSGRSVTNHYHDRLFPGYRIGKKSIRFRVSEVLAAIERQNKKSPT